MVPPWMTQIMYVISLLSLSHTHTHTHTISYKDGENVLNLAAMNGHRKVVAYLIEEEGLVPTDEAGWTPLVVASNREQLDVIEYLLSLTDDFSFLDQSGDIALTLGNNIFPLLSFFKIKSILI